MSVVAVRPEAQLSSPAAQWTPHELELVAVGVAARLARAGVRRENAVILDVRDPLLLFALMLGVAHLGATAITHDAGVDPQQAARDTGAAAVVRDAARAQPGDLDPFDVVADPAAGGSLDLELWVDLPQALVHLHEGAPRRHVTTSGARLFRRLAQIERGLVVPTTSGGVLAAVDPATPTGFAVMLILANRRHEVLLVTADGLLPTAQHGLQPQLVLGTTQRLAALHVVLETRWPDVVVHDLEGGPQPLPPGGGTADRVVASAPDRGRSDSAPLQNAAGGWAEMGRLLRIVRDDPAAYRLAVDRLAELHGLSPWQAAGRIA